MSQTSSRIRSRVLAFVGALILLSLLGSTLSLVQISKVNRSLESINRVALPLTRLFAQVQIDFEVFRREAQKSVGSLHWNDPHWVAQPLPQWIGEVISGELSKMQEMVGWVPARELDWKAWAQDLKRDFEVLQSDGDLLFQALEKKDFETAGKQFSTWNARLEEWHKRLTLGMARHEQILRDRLIESQASVSQLRTGLELILVVVVCLSLLLLWLGERALRPIDELTRLARSITERGLERGDKNSIPELHFSRDDEVSALAREFHRMATQLLEWEKVVQGQKRVLADQNQLLKEKVELQEKLKEIEHLAAIGRLSAQVAHEVRNPLHAIGLEAELALETATAAGNSSLRSALQAILSSVDRLEKITENYLKLSRMGTGEKKSVSLLELLQNVLATYATSIERSGVKVEWGVQAGVGSSVKEDSPQEALRVHVDATNFEQALANLLNNALQAQCTRILFTLGTLESGRAFIRIEDDGSGIPEAIRGKLFTPFSTTKAQGTGLGLSFVKKVVEEAQGEVRLVEPTRLGGAGFEILLPSGLEQETEHSGLRPEGESQSLDR